MTHVQWTLRPLVAFALLAVLPSAGLNAQAPPITVAVDFADSTGAVSGAFSAALRSLGDISVVSRSERPMYVLEGVVLCQPNCMSAREYYVSLRLLSPLQPNMAEFVAWGSLRRSGAPAAARVDSVYAFIWSQLQTFERTHNMWSAAWGRDRYELSVRELIRAIDVRCFEKERMLRRALALPAADSVRYRGIFREINSRDWMC